MVAFAFLCAGLVLTRGEGKFTFIRSSLRFYTIGLLGCSDSPIIGIGSIFALSADNRNR